MGERAEPARGSPGGIRPGALVTFAAALAFLSAETGCGERAIDPHLLRVGHFSNVTHVQGVVAHHGSRGGKGWFESRLPAGTSIRWTVYGAGPQAMLDLLAGELDLVYVGPSPAINAHVKSEGDEVRVVSGAMRGGSALVVQGDGRIAGPQDFRGKRVATPQIGNTQDVACRSWLLRQGFRVTQTGGDVTVRETSNADLLGRFLGNEIDAAWTVEPWVSRLEVDARAKVFLEEAESTTTLLVASERAMRERRDLVRAFVEAHVELTAWVTAHPAEAKAAVREELKAETGSTMTEALLDRCWPRLHPGTDVDPAEFEKFVTAAKEAGSLKVAIPLTRFVEKP